MRICMISPDFPPETGWDGAAVATHQLARGLKELGHELEVIALSRDSFENSQATPGPNRTLIQEGIKVHRVNPINLTDELGMLSSCIPNSKYVFRITTALWAKFVELHSKKPFDVIDAPELLAGGVFAALTRTVPLVTRLHTVHAKFITGNFHDVAYTFDHRMVALIRKLTLIKANMVVSDSKELVDQLRADLRMPDKKLTLIGNAIDSQKFTANGDKAFNYENAILVSVAGTNSVYLSQLGSSLAAILERNPNCHMIISGSETFNFSGERLLPVDIQQVLSKRLGKFKERITYSVRIPLAELAAHYRSAKVFISATVPPCTTYPTYSHLEAMSCGVPTITLDSNPHGVLENGKTGYVLNLPEINKLPEAVSELLFNTQKRNDLIQNGLELINAEYERKQVARQTEVVYKQAIESFARGVHTKLYLRGAEKSITDTTSMYKAVDRMLYDLFYQHSISFRVKHWLNLFFDKPDLAKQKLLGKLGNLSRSANATLAAANKNE